MSEQNRVVGIQPTEHCAVCIECCAEPVSERCYPPDAHMESEFLCPNGHTWIVKWLPQAGER